MSLTIDVVRSAPRTADAIGVPVATTGPVPRVLGLGRAALTAAGFEGKSGQTLVIPAAEGPAQIAVGIGAPGELTANLLVTTGTMTNRIDRLEARGLVRRLPNPDDRRSIVVELTTPAVALVDQAIERHVANEQEMIAPLTARDRAELRRILRKLLAHLGA